jgi:ribose transport system substrate-binding protein
VKHSLWIALLAALASVGFAIWGLWPDAGARQDPQRQVALVLDTDIGVNSAAISQGAQMAATEYGAALNIDALSGEQAPEMQINLIRRQLEDGASGILLVPADAGLVSRASNLCEQYSARLVLLDTCEAYRGASPYVGTDHVSSGARAAEKLLEDTGAKRILVLYQDGDISQDRLSGVNQAAARSGAQVVAGVVPTISGEPCNDAIQLLLQENLDVRAILCLDGALTECAAQEIDALGLKGQVSLAGFDCDQTYISCLEDGSVEFTVLREPLAVGYEGFKCLMGLMTWGVTVPVQYVDDRVIPHEDILKPENVRLVFPLIQ